VSEGALDIPVLNDFSANQSCFYWTVADIWIDERIHVNAKRDRKS